MCTSPLPEKSIRRTLVRSCCRRRPGLKHGGVSDSGCILCELPAVLFLLLILASLALLLLFAALLDLDRDAVGARQRVLALPRRLDVLLVVVARVCPHHRPALHQAQAPHSNSRQHLQDRRRARGEQPLRGRARAMRAQRGIAWPDKRSVKS